MYLSVQSDDNDDLFSTMERKCPTGGIIIWDSKVISYQWYIDNVHYYVKTYS